jgi:hypothetical protein
VNRHFYPRALLLGALLATACAEQTFEALSSPPPIEIDATDLPVSVDAGATVAIEIRAKGGEGLHTWRVAEGALPPGLGLMTDGSAKAVIAGTSERPSVTTAYDATIEVEDVYGNTGRTEFRLMVSVGLTPSTLQIVTATVASGRVGEAYLEQIDAQGGTSQGYTWSVVAGALPSGLSLTSTGAPSGLVIGVPTQTGTVTARVRVTDSGANTDERDFTFIIRGRDLYVATSTLSLACTSSSTTYLENLEARGGTGTGYTWSIASGALPPGLSLTIDGIIWGQVAGSGTYNFVARVEDSAGASATRALAIRVSCGVMILDSNLGATTTTRLFEYQLTATGGIPPYSWLPGAEGTPSGLQLLPNGLLRGVPTTTGTVAFAVTVQDSAGNYDVETLHLQVVGPVRIRTSSVADGYLGVPYYAPLSATGGLQPYEWSGWEVPPGYQILSSGAIAGTATASTGYYLAVVFVHDHLQQVASATVSIRVY